VSSSDQNSIDFMAGVEAGAAGYVCPNPWSTPCKVGWLVGSRQYLTDQLSEARARVTEVEQTTVQRIIEACNTVRAEYHAKMAKQHEENMVRLGELRNEIDERVRAARVDRDAEWHAGLRAKGWGDALLPNPEPSTNKPNVLRSTLESILVTIGLARSGDALDQLNSDHFPRDGEAA
jgi:hypothetical protein